MTIMDEVEIKESDDEYENDSESEQSNNSGEEELANTGWADAISKILKQKSKKKTIVLSKAKKISDVKKVKKESHSFQIESADGVAKNENEDSKDVKQELGEPPKKRKKETTNIRVKPDILQKDRERLLLKIATKGVVQLFNAVKSQQKDISKKLEEAGPLEVRKEKVLKNIDKRAFLDVLMGEKSQRIDTNVEKKEETTENVSWSVLKDDFMIGAKMRNWDKDLEIDEIEAD